MRWWLDAYGLALNGFCLRQKYMPEAAISFPLLEGTLYQRGVRAMEAP